MQKVIGLAIVYKKMGCIYFCKKHCESSSCYADNYNACIWNVLIIALFEDKIISNLGPERL